MREEYDAYDVEIAKMLREEELEHQLTVEELVEMVEDAS